MRPPAETTAIFVADGAAMQAQGLLLAHSLRRHGGAGLAVIAYVPEGAEPPDAAMRAGYAAVGARLEPLETPAIWKKPFPHGNKIHACCAARDRPATLFLDTDTVLIRALDRRPACLLVTGRLLAEIHPDLGGWQDTLAAHGYAPRAGLDPLAAAGFSLSGTG